MPATSRCSSQRCDRSGTAPCASASPATTCSTWPGRWCSRDGLPREQRDRDRAGDARGHGSGAEPGGAPSAPARCCCTRRSCERRAIDASIAYLARRLDENTAPENFLRALFTIHAGSAEFAEQAERFRTRRRRPSRRCRRRVAGVPRAATGARRSRNEPDSDPTDRRRPRAVCTCGARRRRRPSSPRGRRRSPAIDDVVASRPCGAASSGRSTQRRRAPAILAAVADGVHGEQRFDTIQMMADEAVKVAREGDPEVSEAIDFARYYGTVGLDVLEQQRVEGAELAPRGVVVVASPWNFPYAIPAGGVLAALAAGNTVILKPAPEAVAPRSTSSASCIAPAYPTTSCSSSPAPTTRSANSHHPSRRRRGRSSPARTRRRRCSARGSRRCICSPRPAARTRSSSPRPPTSIWRSAIWCARRSATPARSAPRPAWRSSKRRVYDTPSFLERLADAPAACWSARPADLGSVVGPLIGDRRRSCCVASPQLDAGERWLVDPRRLDGTAVVARRARRRAARLWFHVTECFGPVLGVMRADDLDHAIELQNATPYGLTGGIHSLDAARDRAVARRRARSATPTSTAASPVRSCSASRSVGGSGRRSAAARRRAGPTTSPRWSSASHRRVDVGTRRAVVPPGMVGVVLASATTRPVWSASATSCATARCDGVLRSSRRETRPRVRCGSRRCRRGRAGRVVEVSDAAHRDRAGVARRWVDWASSECACSRGQRRLLPSACHELAIEIDTEPVSVSGRRELRRWMREQAISRTTHRHGRVAAVSHGCSASPIGVLGGPVHERPQLLGDAPVVARGAAARRAGRTARG